MKTCLLSWIGKADLAASRGEAKAGVGPIGQAVAAREFKEVVLLTDFPEDEVQAYVEWLETQTRSKVFVRRAKLTGPTNLSEIYPAARDALEDLTSSGKEERQLTVHISPGTPAMAAVWILLAKSRFPGRADRVFEGSWCPHGRSAIRYRRGLCPRSSASPRRGARSTERGRSTGGSSVWRHPLPQRGHEAGCQSGASHRFPFDSGIDRRRVGDGEGAIGSRDPSNGPTPGPRDDRGQLRRDTF